MTQEQLFDEPDKELVRGPLKWHGGKSYLAKRIVELMPRHLHYVEPFAGGLAVLMARDPADPRLWLADTSSQRGVSEVVNDLDGDLINFWRVLRDEQLFAQFARQANAIPLSRDEWNAAYYCQPIHGALQAAVNFFVCCRQSRSGLRKGFTPLTRNRTRRRMNGNVSEWLSAVEGLPAVHDRLRRVAVENKPAVDLIQEHDEPGTLFYCDPPYLHETRTARKAYGRFEMPEADHRQLLDVLLACRGKVMLSGYPSRLYDEALAGWTRHIFDLPNNAAGGASKDRETEVLWCNWR
jgi:DNA adenine methylase